MRGTFLPQGTKQPLFNNLSQRGVTMLHSLFSCVSVIVTALFLTACGGGGDDGNTLPLATADEVKAAFDKAPRILPEKGEIVGSYPQQMNDPYYVEYRGMTSTGIPVVLTLRFQYRLVPTSKVVVGEALPPKLQSITARIAGIDNPVPVLDVREYQGWLILYASLRAVAAVDWRVDRWVMYQPGTKQLVDCGESGSIRPPEWGVSVSSECTLVE